jgi:hypothetical protein
VASGVPDAIATPRPLRRRDWHAYGNYKVVHENQMAVLIDDGTVVRDTQTFRESRDTRTGDLVAVNLRGRVHTTSGGILVVNKWLEVRHAAGQVEVRTREYNYHAFIRKPPPRRDMFRYDNCHGSLDTLHCHHFNDEGEPLMSEMIRHDRMPFHSEIIREAESRAAALAQLRTQSAGVEVS